MQNISERDTEIIFFKMLHRYGVKYLLIGRQACILWGIPVNTFDYDIAVDNSTENLKKLFKIADELELYPSKGKEKILNKKEPLFCFQNDIKIDVFCAKKYGTADNNFLVFSEAFKRRKTLKDGKYGLIFYTPSIDDLIMFKKINPREKDIDDIKMLEEIRKISPQKKLK